MKKISLGLAALIIAGTAGMGVLASTPKQQPAASASHQAQAQFAIRNMTCATCPITVRKAMEKVPGVTAVSVDFSAKTARATYDPRRTNAAAIAAASTNAGYPARLMEKP